MWSAGVLYHCWHEARQVSVPGSCLGPRPAWPGRGSQLEEVSNKAVLLFFFLIFFFLPYFVFPGVSGGTRHHWRPGSNAFWKMIKFIGGFTPFHPLTPLTQTLHRPGQLHDAASAFN